MLALEGTRSRYEHIDKLPRIYPAVEYSRTKEGERRMKHYNGLVQLEVNKLSGRYEVEFVKRQAELLPQTFAARTSLRLYGQPRLQEQARGGTLFGAFLPDKY